MTSTKFVFFGPIGKTRLPPWPLIGWDIFNFSSETMNGIQWNFTGSKNSTSSTKFVFFGPIGKTRWPPWPLIGWDNLTSPLKPLNGIQWNLTGSKISMSSTKFVFFGPIGKTRWPSWPLIGWDIFDFPLKPLNGIQRNLTGSKISMSSTKFVFFGPIGKNKMAALASDWLRHFLLLLRNRWTEFNETLQEARSQLPLPSLCFSGWSEKQDGRPGLWLAETFSTSPLKPLNRIQWNLTGSKISMSSTKFVFFGLIRKQKWPPWLIPQKGGTLYSGARYVALWASCFIWPNSW